MTAAPKTVLVKEYEPVGDRIAVRPDKPDDTWSKAGSGIIKADISVESKQFGTVIAVSQELEANYRARALEHVLPKVGERVAWGDMLHIDLKHISADDIVVLRYPAEVVTKVRYVERAVTPEEEKAATEPKIDVMAETRKELGLNR